MATSNQDLLAQELIALKNCQLCPDLALGPNPIFQVSSSAKILIAGQAPGRITHHLGRPFDDPSGNRLRDWMGIDRDTFYDASNIAILPMAFCYPGTGKNGDLPPPARCAEHWRARLLAELTNIHLTLVIGQYAMDYHLSHQKEKTLTETVKQWRKHWPEVLPLPHPSPRNNRWLKTNPWFEEDVLPVLRVRLKNLLL